MPQSSVSYACGRVGVLRRSALRASQLERLMATHTYAEACRALCDIGFMAAEGMDFQQAADAHVKKACELLREVTPDPALTDCFLLRYDAHNLKVLIKSRFLAQKPAFLSACGVMNVETLRHAVSERRYQALPPVFKEALDALEKELAKKFDPMLIDVEIDKAAYRQIAENLSRVNNPSAKRYFRARADTLNFIMLLRARAMGKNATFFAGLYLPGGSVKLSAFQKAFDQPEKLGALMKPYGETMYRAALQCAMEPGKLPLMEKVADDYLYALYAHTRYQTDSVDMLVGYLLQAQREATDVRLIMAGKLNDFKQSELEERVRELNG